MKPIHSLLGRRQFMMAAAAASTSALAVKKLAGFVDVDFQTGVAMASDNRATASVKKTGNSYSHLLSPIRIRNVIVKNRMLYAVSTPALLQGPETFPSDVVRSYYANIAKGAAIVSCRFDEATRSRKELTGDSAHMAMFDMSDPAVRNYIDQLVEGVHCMGSLVSGGSIGGGGPGSKGPSSIDDILTQAKKLEDQGFDVVEMGGRSIDLQDKDAVNRVIDQMQAVKKATNLIIMMSMVVINPSVRPKMCDSGQNILGVITMDDAVATAKTFDDSADILFINAFTGMNTFPGSYNMEKGEPANIAIAQAIKENGAKIIVAPNGGFRDPELNDEFIKSGKADIIAMARPFISDPDYGRKVYEGRGEDIVPCIMCNKCLLLSLNGPWYNACSVNPKLGLESAVKVIDAPGASKKVAVIGGGPAGMKAAITAAERGHRVTLYEKNNYLGGLMRHADYSPFKWALKDYKDYLVRQVEKNGIEVLLGTEATQEMIRKKGFDVVVAAIGSEPVMPEIPGADNGNVLNFINAYPKEKELGKDIVVIGQGEFGVDIGMYLAKSGHKTTMLTEDKELVSVDRVHSVEQVVDAYEHLENFDYIMGARTINILEGKVTYIDDKGNKAFIKADSVVIFGVLKPRQDEALKFYDASPKAFFIAGDCTGKCGNVQKTIRSAFFAASQI